LVIVIVYVHDSDTVSVVDCVDEGVMVSVRLGVTVYVSDMVSVRLGVTVYVSDMVFVGVIEYVIVSEYEGEIDCVCVGVIEYVIVSETVGDGVIDGV